MQCLVAFWRLFVQRDSIARLQASQSKSSHNKVISDSLILQSNCNGNNSLNCIFSLRDVVDWYVYEIDLWPRPKIRLLLSDVTSDSNTFSHENLPKEGRKLRTVMANAKTEWKPFYTLNQTIEKTFIFTYFIGSFIGLLGLLYYYSFFIWNQI